MNTEKLALIEQALDVTLCESQLLRGNTVRRATSRSHFDYWIDDECIDVSEEISSLLDIVASPIKTALMRQLNRIGQMLFEEVKSTAAMREITEWAASLDVDNYDFRIDALDNAFEGVGEGEDVWHH